MPRIILTDSIHLTVIGDAGAFAPRISGELTPVEAAQIMHENKGEIFGFVQCGLSEPGATYHAFLVPDELPLFEEGKRYHDQIPPRAETSYRGSVRKTWEKSDLPAPGQTKSRLVLLHKETGYVAGDAAIFAPGSDETLNPAWAAMLLHASLGEKVEFVQVPIDIGTDGNVSMNFDATYFVHIADSSVPFLDNTKALTTAETQPKIANLRLIASVKRVG